MSAGFPELVLGDVLVAPFVPLALAAFVLFLVVRPIFRLVHVERIFADPPLVSVCVFVILLAVLTVLF